MMSWSQAGWWLVVPKRREGFAVWVRSDDGQIMDQNRLTCACDLAMMIFA